MIADAFELTRISYPGNSRAERSSVETRRGETDGPPRLDLLQERCGCLGTHTRRGCDYILQSE
jgi:hypothetical protein